MSHFKIERKSDSHTMDAWVAVKHRHPFGFKITHDRTVYLSGYTGEEELWILIHKNKSHGAGCSSGNLGDIGHYYQRITKNGKAMNKFFVMTQLMEHGETAKELCLPQKPLMKI
jgi:hypothetical protein